MKMLLVSAMAIVSCSLAASGWCSPRVLVEWDFTAAADRFGWTAAERLEHFACEGGALVAKSAGVPIKLESPIFDIPAEPNQYVEIAMRTDADGDAILYYSNTTEEPYRGFRPNQYVRFAVTGGQEFRTYTVLPFWQRQGRIIHIRIDPPGSRAELRSVKIVSAGPQDRSTEHYWSFDGSESGWSFLGSGGKAQPADGCVRIEGSAGEVFLSPLVGIDTVSRFRVTLRLRSPEERAVLFKWATDQADGMQSVPVLLKPGDRVRSYTLDLSDVPAWSGRVVALGISPSDSREPGTVEIESVDVAARLSGPARLEIRRLALDRPFIRAGSHVSVVAEVVNTGSTPARLVRATAHLTVADASRTLLPARQTESLASGESLLLEWRAKAPQEGVLTLSCEVSAADVETVQKQTAVRVYPPVPSAVQRGRIPDPVPADTSPYMVGAYYYPGWHTYERWSVLDDYPERRPVLGYYREGDPEVADWHILWALEHGISFFIYDWYWHEGKRQLEHALHDGLFNSRFQDRIKFCLLWANHNPPAREPERDLIEVTQYWIDNYFRRPGYLKIDGRNVVIIFSPWRLTEDLGSDGVRRSFDTMRKMCEDAGVGGLYVIACTYPGDEAVRRLELEGYDALTGYNYPAAGDRGRIYAPYEWMVDGYLDYWTRIDAAAQIPYIPVCEPGWDSRPWHGLTARVRTGKTPELWRKMLENARGFVDTPERALPVGKKFVFLEAWNEFGEGDYIEPHAEFGFDYLEAVRQVFAPSSSKPVIVVPDDVGLGPYAILAPEPKTEWDFSRPEDCSWTGGNLSELSYADGVLRAVARTNDPAVYSPVFTLDASVYRTVEITMKTDAGDEAQLFFRRRRAPMTENNSIRFPIVSDGEFRTYTLDLGGLDRWFGTIEQVRLDPNSAAGSRTEVRSVRFK